MSERPRWETPAGPIVGVRDGDVVRALGIPYATTTRHGLPVAVEPFAEPFDACTPSPLFPQRIDEGWESLYLWKGEPVTYDEDCTRLSVTMPADMEPGEALPVLVWIHGGSYIAGGADVDIYDPASLVLEQRLVVVGVTYRLGLLGYLGRGEGMPANLGLHDQVAAVRWVAENIAAFGGDPDNVTLCGESAGADAVAHLMVVDEVRGLFRRAIIQSPPLGVMPDRAGLSAAMADAVGELAPDAVWDVVAEAQDRAAAAAAPFGIRAGMPYGVQYGHAPLPDEDALDAAYRFAAREVDILIGSTAREGSLFVDDVPAFTRALGLPVVGPQAREAGTKALTEMVYARPIKRFAQRHHAAGGHGYRYTYRWGARDNFYRATHTSDLPLLFGTPAAWHAAWAIRGKSAAEIDADGRRLRAIWGEFARTGRLEPRREAGLIDIVPLP